MPFVEYAECPGCGHREEAPAPHAYPGSWFRIVEDTREVCYCTRRCAGQYLLTGEIDRSHPFGLTDTEVAIVRGLALGLTSTQMRLRVHLATRTIKNRFGVIYAKLGVHDHQQAVWMALAVGIIDTVEIGREFNALAREFHANVQERSRQRVGLRSEIDRRRRAA